jgi:uncharacterized membrane protein HdeD (DUF308 family)
MLAVLAREWWLLFVRGMLAVLWGVVALTWPRLTWHGLTVLFGTYTTFDGIAVLVIAYYARNVPGGWSFLFEAVVRIGTGLVVLTVPWAAASRLPTVIAAWAAVSALGQLAAAGTLRHELAGEWPLPIASILSLIVAAFLAANPGAAAAGIAWLIGPYALLFGFTILAFAYRLWQLSREMARAPVEG